MKLLLTGASGFTGRHLRAVAESAGYEVVSLQANVTDKEALDAELIDTQPDLVAHLAAVSFVGHEDESAFYEVNVVGTSNLLKALSSLPKPPAKVLLSSSANIYGNSESSPVCETDLAAPINHYAISKLAMEHAARMFMDRLPIVLSRPFNYTGPWQAANFIIPKLVKHFANREREIELGNLNVEREFNDVRMVCDAYLALLQYGVAGEAYNICSGKTYSLSQVIELLEELTEHSLKITVNPIFVRANEVHRLCGDPTKLQTLMQRTDNSLPEPDLRETLQWMLNENKN